MINGAIPPEFPDYVYYWERSRDPWHASAFPDDMKHLAPHQGEPCSGWMAIDGVENPVGFVPDSEEGIGAVSFILREGKYGRTCAYRD